MHISSLVGICHVVCCRAALHRLPALRMGMYEGSLGCLQNCCGLVRCVCKKLSISMPSLLAVHSNLHLIFNVPLRNCLCMALFSGSILFNFTILYLFSFLLVIFYFFFLINCASITFRRVLLKHS